MRAAPGMAGAAHGKACKAKARTGTRRPATRCRSRRTCASPTAHPPRMHQDRLDPSRHQDRKGRLPVDPDPFHDRSLDAATDQSFDHFLKLVRKRAEAGRLHHRFALAIAQENRRGDLHLVHIETRRAGGERREGLPSSSPSSSFALSPRRRQGRRSEGHTPAERVRFDLPRVHGQRPGTVRDAEPTAGNSLSSGTTSSTKKTLTRPRLRHTHPATAGSGRAAGTPHPNSPCFIPRDGSAPRRP